jgi:hypothetical protein
MPREYQNVKNNPYKLPHNVYYKTLYTIRDYDRLKEKYNELLHKKGAWPNVERGKDERGKMVADIMPKSANIASSVEDRAMQLALMSKEIDAVDYPAALIPAAYRNGVLQNIKYGGHYPRDADVRTYQRWKQRFIYFVAKRLKHV